MRRIFIAAAILTAASFALPSCKKSKDIVKTDAIRVQGLFSLKGNWSSLGVNSYAAMQIAADDINKYFADKNLPYSIGVDASNTTLDATLAAKLFTNAQSSGVKFFLGPQSSAELAALKPLVDASQTLVISQSSTAGSLAIAGDGIFRFCPSDKIEGAAMGNTIYKQGIRGLVTVARNDDGNKGLQTTTGAAFAAKGGEISAVTPYAATTTDFTAVIADIKTKLAALTTKYGAMNTAVYLASFDEAITLFKAAATDAGLSAVKWYGGDGVVLSDAFLKDAAAANFAIKTSFFAPSVGLPAASQAQWKPIADRITAKTKLTPDAFALAVYDAMWALAYTIEELNGNVDDYAKVKATFIAQTAKHTGITGSDALDDAGDRATGTFDYYAIKKDGTTYTWYVVSNSEQ